MLLFNDYLTIDVKQRGETCRIFWKFRNMNRANHLNLVYRYTYRTSSKTSNHILTMTSSLRLSEVITLKNKCTKDKSREERSPRISQEYQNSTSARFLILLLLQILYMDTFAVSRRVEQRRLSPQKCEVTQKLKTYNPQHKLWRPLEILSTRLARTQLLREMEYFK